MNPETTTPAELSLWTIVQSQINTLLAILVRPVVQQQILTILAILLCTWMLPELVRYWQLRHTRRIPAILRKHPGWDKALGWAYLLVAPIGSLLLTSLAIWIFDRNGHPRGLLSNTLALFYIWLAFRLLATVVRARWAERGQPYRRWVLTPLFAIAVFWHFVGSSVSVSLLFTLPVFNFGGITITLADFLTASVAFYFFAVGSWIIEQLLNRTLPTRLEAEPGVVQSVATLVRYAILAIGIITSLAIMGFNATSLAIVAGGLSVGIGIGLQDIVANFVSGMTLLFEQSLRPGDIIELEGRIHEVEKVTLRATMVRNLDNVKLIIPNAQFTTAQVNTLTKSDRNVRARIPFAVHYNSDLALVRQVALDVAAQHEMTLSTPPPNLLNQGFGDSALTFELLAWIDQPKAREAYRSDLYDQLTTAFRANGISIPYPQRDLHLRSGWDELGR